MGEGESGFNPPHLVRYTIKEFKIMNNRSELVIGFFVNTDTGKEYARVSIDKNLIIHCKLVPAVWLRRYKDHNYNIPRITRYRGLYLAQLYLQDIADCTLKFITV